MITATDNDLYLRGAATLLASWEQFARGARDATVQRSPGVASAVFPHGPERAFFNNALLDRNLAPSARADAVHAMEAVYAAAGVEQFAAWVHESDHGLRGHLEQRGYTVSESTLAMGMTLDDWLPRRPEIELAPPDWLEHLRILDVPPGLLRGAARSAFQVLNARLGGTTVATALALDLAGDCGIYNVTTLEHARRRGLGAALTVLHLHDARARGCLTASVQATEMAERVYIAAGFHDLGRILEFVPAEHSSPR